MRTVQADSWWCLNYEQIVTLSVVGGGGVIGLEAQNVHVTVRIYF